MLSTGLNIGAGSLPLLGIGVAAGAVAGWLLGRASCSRTRRLQAEIWRSKRQLQAIFDGITDGLIIVDRAFRIVAVNKAEASFLGREPQELVGRPCYEVYLTSPDRHPEGKFVIDICEPVKPL